MIKNINNYLESTYLKTPKQANLSVSENQQVLLQIVNQAITNQFKLVMLRPTEITWVKAHLIKQKSKVLIGTVISFPEGNNSTEDKAKEMQKAIKNGADELDVVINYEAFKNQEINLIKTEILVLTQLALSNHKIIKFIIETAALSVKEIIQISALIKNTITKNFKENDFEKVFIKSSTGFYQSQNNQPNGATIEAIIVMLENGSPLPIKASGGIKDIQTAVNYIKLGVKRLGTSSAFEIITGKTTKNNY